MINAHPKYRKRGVPRTFDPGWFDTELGNIQRGAPAQTGQIILNDIRVDGTIKYYWCDTTNGAITIALPRADQVQDLEIVVKKIAGGSSVTVTGTIEGGTDYVLSTLYDTITLVSSGVEWYLTSTLP